MSRYPDYQARLAAWSDIQGHLEFMYGTVCGYQAPDVIELGVRSGNSTVALLAGAEMAGGVVWSADVAPPMVPASWHSDPHWKFVLGDDMSQVVLDYLPAACQVLFIDTSHTFDHTLAELRAYVPRVLPGGVVLLHDTHSLEHGTADTEVARALDVFCAETGRTWSDRMESYGMGIIRA